MAGLINVYEEGNDAYSDLIVKSNVNRFINNAKSTTVANAVTVTSGGLTVTAGGLTVTAGDLTITADQLVFGAAASTIVPGATSLSLRNNADSADNVLISNAGAVTVRAGLTVTASGLTVTAGGITITAGGLTVTADGATVTAGGVTITDGGLAVRAGARIREALTLTNITTVGAGTYTAAALVGGLITRDPTGGDRTDTMDTGTNIETELNAQGIAVATGDTFICHVVNTADAAETITFAGDTGSTIANAGQTLAQNESCYLLFKRTGANAYTFYVMGG